jgi:hypothetical protein
MDPYKGQPGNARIEEMQEGSGVGGVGLEQKVSALQAELEHVKVSQAAEVQAIRLRAKQDNRMSEEARQRAERELVEKSDQIWEQSSLTSEELCSSSCSVRVAHPQERSGGYMGAYISYRLTTAVTRLACNPSPEQSSGTESPEQSSVPKDQIVLKKACVVNRRYNDFAWLRGQLVQQFPASLVPCLPSAKAHTTFLASLSSLAKKEFLEKRCRALNHFIDNVVAYPQYARAAPFVLMFLSLDEAQWEATMKEYGCEADTEQQEQQEQLSASPPKAQWMLHGLSPPSDNNTWQSSVMGSVQTVTGAAATGLQKTLSGVIQSLGNQTSAESDWSAASGPLGSSGVVGKVSIGVSGLVGSSGGWKGDDSEEMGFAGLGACCDKFRDMRSRVRLLRQALLHTSQLHSTQAAQLQAQHELAAAMTHLEFYEAQFNEPEFTSGGTWFSSTELDLDEALAAAAIAAAETDLSLSGIQERKAGGGSKGSSDSVADKVAAAVARGEAAVARADMAAVAPSSTDSPCASNGGPAGGASGGGSGGSGSSGRNFGGGEEVGGTPGGAGQDRVVTGAGTRGSHCKIGPGAETSLAMLARFLATAAAEPLLQMEQQQQQQPEPLDATNTQGTDRPRGLLPTYRLQCELENENLVLKSIVDAESRLVAAGTFADINACLLDRASSSLFSRRAQARASGSKTRGSSKGRQSGASLDRLHGAGEWRRRAATRARRRK